MSQPASGGTAAPVGPRNRSEATSWTVRLGAGGDGTGLSQAVGRRAAGRGPGRSRSSWPRPDFRNRFAQEVAAARRVSGAFTAAVVAADQQEPTCPGWPPRTSQAPSLSTLGAACDPCPYRRSAGWRRAAAPGAGVDSRSRASTPGPEAIQRAGRTGRAAGHRLRGGQGGGADQLTVTRGAVGTRPTWHPSRRRTPGTGHDGQRCLLARRHDALRRHRARPLPGRDGHGPAGTARDGGAGPGMAPAPRIVVACLDRDPRKRQVAAVLAAMAHRSSAWRSTATTPVPASLPGAALTYWRNTAGTRDRQPGRARRQSRTRPSARSQCRVRQVRLAGRGAASRWGRIASWAHSWRAAKPARPGEAAPLAAPADARGSRGGGGRPDDVGRGHRTQHRRKAPAGTPPAAGASNT